MQRGPLAKDLVQALGVHPRDLPDVEVAEPSATTLPGLELAVETPALTVPGESVTSKDCAKPKPFRVAETWAVPATVPEVKVAV